jgi:hypothetical protein
MEVGILISVAAIVICFIGATCSSKNLRAGRQ